MCISTPSSMYFRIRIRFMSSMSSTLVKQGYGHEMKEGSRSVRERKKVGVGVFLCAAIWQAQAVAKAFKQGFSNKGYKQGFQTRYSNKGGPGFTHEETKSGTGWRDRPVLEAIVHPLLTNKLLILVPFRLEIQRCLQHLLLVERVPPLGLYQSACLLEIPVRSLLEREPTPVFRLGLQRKDDLKSVTREEENYIAQSFELKQSKAARE